MEKVLALIQQYQSLEFDTIIDYEKFNDYDIVHHSSSIEGSTLTINETRLLLEEDITPKGKPLSHTLMTKDHYVALKFVLDEAVDPNPIKPSFINSINALVMRNTGGIYNTILGQVDASKGEYRKGNVSAGSSYFPSYDKVISLTIDLVNQLNQKLLTVKSETEILELSFAAHFNLVSIHPFYEGNGRTSRLLMNYIQRRFKLPLAIVYKEDKVEYFNALQESRKLENIAPFNLFMYQQYEKYLVEEINQYKEIHKKENQNKGLSFLF